MDVNANPSSHENGTFEMVPVHEDCIVSAWNREEYWTDIMKDLSLSRTSEDSIRRMKIMHVQELDWDLFFKKTAVTEARTFWLWVRDMLILGGKYVQELTVEFHGDSDNEYVQNDIRDLKIQILASLHKWCPSLKALQISGPSIEFNEKERCFFEQVIKETGKAELDFIGLPLSFATGSICNLMKREFLSGTQLRTMSIFAEQLVNAADEMSFPSLKTLKMGHYGRLFTRQEEFHQMIIKMCPVLTRLVFFRMCLDICHDLSIFINSVCSQRKLLELSVDQSSRTFKNANNEKVRHIKTLTVDLRTPLEPSMDIVKHVLHADEIVISNYKPDAELEDKLMEIIRAEISSCGKIIFMDRLEIQKCVVLN